MSRESGIGGGIIAMAGKKCVAIASDLRYGWGYQVTTKTFHKIFPINSKCLFGAQGLYTDIQTVYEKSRFNANMYRLREGREINGKQFICSTGHLLYKNRFASPYIAAARGYVDDVIEPDSTRPRIIAALEMLASKRDSLPAKKHGNFPV